MRKVLIGCLALLTFVSCARNAGEPGLRKGTRAPDFTAATYDGRTIRLSDYYKKGPVVLIFYRGGWCKYCNRQLQDYQSRLGEFERVGASIIAVSVDKPEKSAETANRHRLGYDVISDPGAELLKKYNAIYEVPPAVADQYKNEYGIDLEAASGRTDHIIAVPATYVINQKGKIIFAHSDRDYKNRKKAFEILGILKGKSET